MPDQPLPRSTPEEQGVASAAILAFLDAAEARVDALHSIMLVRHGHVIAEGWWEPYRAERPHVLFSVSKSFTATAVGLAVAEGRLSIEDTVLSLLPDDAPAVVGEYLAAMRVRHLLTMTTGHDTDTAGRMSHRADGDWVRGCLELPVEHPPGTRFVYNSGATYLLAAILHRLTGQTLLEYLRPRLFEPLGIGPAEWERCPRGINVGGWGLSLRTVDVAKFGELYLRDGVWRGRQVVPAGWVRAATAGQVGNAGTSVEPDWQQGYGYQFWRCRHEAYRGDGAFGQFCVVFPERDAVLVFTGGLPDMQAVLDLVWQHLLPALTEGPALAEGPAPADEPARLRLAERLAALRLPALRSTATPAAGVAGRVFRLTGPLAPPRAEWLPDHEHPPTVHTVVLAPHPDGWAVTLHDADGEYVFVCADGDWRTGEVPFNGRPAPVATTGGWTGPRTFTLRVCYTATPFIRTYTIESDGTRLRLGARDNVSFVETTHPPTTFAVSAATTVV